jgi:methylenetetrahydrofolate reductase (NADPH)
MTTTEEQQMPDTGLNISFEFFPPKNEAGVERLVTAARALAPYRPRFISVTYGAGGSTRDRTFDTLGRVRRETGVPVAGHLTCVSATREEVDAVASAYAEAGVNHIVALRGDPPGGLDEKYVATQGGYANAADLVRGLRRLGDFEISVSAYPERHPESADWRTDLDLLAEKAEGGATRAITQFFYDNGCFSDYLARVRLLGVDITVVPGILPIIDIKQVKRFARQCGADLPHGLDRRFAGLDARPEYRRNVSIAVAREQVNGLYDMGVRDFHFYTMNRSDFVGPICDGLIAHATGSNGSTIAA